MGDVGDCRHDDIDDTPQGPTGPVDATDNGDKGCGCASTGGSAPDPGLPLGLLLGLLALAALRRRSVR